MLQGPAVRAPSLVFHVFARLACVGVVGCMGACTATPGGGSSSSSSGGMASSAESLGGSSSTSLVSSSASSGPASSSAAQASGSSSGTQSSSAGPGVYTAARFSQERWERMCAYDQRCATLRGTRHQSLAACLDYQGWADSFYATFQTAPTLADVERVYTVDDEAAARACLDTVATLSCLDPAATQACLQHLKPRRPAALNQPCGSLPPDGARTTCWDPAAPLFCDGDGVAACSVCRETKGGGQACQTGVECQSNQCVNGVCTSASSVAAPVELGRSCAMASSVCLGNLICAEPASGTGRVCQALPGVDQPCLANSATGEACQWPLACVANGNAAPTCVAPLEDGTSCSRTPGARCRHICQYTPGNTTTGTCGDLSHLPSAGETCAVHVVGNYIYQSCAAGFFPDTNVAQGTCTCTAQKADGEPCFTQVLEKTCIHACLPDGLGGGVCGTRVPQPNGAHCSQPEDCVNGHCTLASGSGGYICGAHVCQGPMDCSQDPFNITVAAAESLTVGQVHETLFCITPTSLDRYWKIPGPFHAGDALSFHIVDHAAFLEGRPNLVSHLITVLNGTTFQANCIPDHNGLSACAVFLAQDAEELTIHDGYSTGMGPPLVVRQLIQVDLIPAASNTCADAPTNISAETATTLVANQQTMGRACSSNADTEYWWRLPGTFPAGSYVVLEAQPTNASSITLSLIADDQAEGPAHMMDCTFPQDPWALPCEVTIPSYSTNTTGIFVQTAMNPSLPRDVAFTLSLGPTQDPGLNCATAPTNQSKATALELPLGTPVTSQVCGAAVDVEFWWHVAGPFAVGDMLRFTADMPDQQDFGVNMFQYRTPTELGTFSPCFLSQGRTVCQLEFKEAISDVWLNTSMNPNNVRESSLTWTAQRTQDPGFNCMQPPANQTPATAAEVPLNMSTLGLACSSLVERPFWWKVQGPFMAGDRISLDVSYIPEDAFPVMGFKVHTAVNGQPGDVVTSCNGVFGGMEHCEGVLSADTPQLFLEGTTAGQWSGTSAFRLLVGQNLQ